MQASQIPAKFQIPWGNNAGTSYIRTIPQASQISTQPGAASLTDGFPPLTFLDPAAGGIPPDGRDANGIMNQITLWNRWQAAGGPVRYDGTFANAIGGYPAGALVMSDSGHAVYQNMIDNNSGNPNGGAANWRVCFSVWSQTLWASTGSANVQQLTLTPPVGAMSQLLGIPLQILSVGTNTNFVTLQINGQAAYQIQTSGGLPLAGGALKTASPYVVVWNGTTFSMVSGTNSFYDPSTGGVTIVAGTTQGANLALFGDGTVTPKRYLRVAGGLFQIVNNAYNSVLMSMDDAGNTTFAGGAVFGGPLTTTGLTSTGAIAGKSLSVTDSIQVTQGDMTIIHTVAGGALLRMTGNGNQGKSIQVVNNELRILNDASNTILLRVLESGTVTSFGDIVSGNRLRAAVGAAGSGDANAAVLLQDFGSNMNPSGGNSTLSFPDGTIMEMFTVNMGGATSGTYFFPAAFPNYCSSIVATDTGSGVVHYGAAPASNSQFFLWADHNAGPSVASVIAIGK